MSSTGCIQLYQMSLNKKYACDKLAWLLFYGSNHISSTIIYSWASSFMLEIMYSFILYCTWNFYYLCITSSVHVKHLDPFLFADYVVFIDFSVFLTYCSRLYVSNVYFERKKNSSKVPKVIGPIILVTL